MNSQRKPSRPKGQTNTRKKDQKSTVVKQNKDRNLSDTCIPSLPSELQQLILNIFQDSFPERFDDNLPSLLQEVKGHLYNREFALAFGKPEYLEAYAVRWSPSRALAYGGILDWVWRDHFLANADENAHHMKSKRITCIGGGAGAEVVASAAALRQQQSSRGNTSSSSKELSTDTESLEITLIDIASWNETTSKLYTSLTTTPPLSPYASASTKATNTRLIDPSTFNATFHQADVQTLDPAALAPNLQTDLLTLFFTLNELYSTSLALTQTFLLRLTHGTARGTLLLVVDSAGSYSSVSVNGKENKYPMQWLLDHALLGKAGEGRWEKVRETESAWFRVPQGLRYPLELENMRYQLHLYRRV